MFSGDASSAYAVECPSVRRALLLPSHPPRPSLLQRLRRFTAASSSPASEALWPPRPPLPRCHSQPAVRRFAETGVSSLEEAIAQRRAAFGGGGGAAESADRCSDASDRDAGATGKDSADADAREATGEESKVQSAENLTAVCRGRGHCPRVLLLRSRSAPPAGHAYYHSRRCGGGGEERKAQSSCVLWIALPPSHTPQTSEAERRGRGTAVAANTAAANNAKSPSQEPPARGTRHTPRSSAGGGGGNDSFGRTAVGAYLRGAYQSFAGWVEDMVGGGGGGGRGDGDEGGGAQEAAAASAAALMTPRDALWWVDRAEHQYALVDAAHGRGGVAAADNGAGGCGMVSGSASKDGEDSTRHAHADNSSAVPDSGSASVPVPPQATATAAAAAAAAEASATATEGVNTNGDNNNTTSKRRSRWFRRRDRPPAMVMSVIPEEIEKDDASTTAAARAHNEEGEETHSVSATTAAGANEGQAQEHGADASLGASEEHNPRETSAMVHSRNDSSSSSGGNTHERKKAARAERRDLRGWCLGLGRHSVNFGGRSLWWSYPDPGGVYHHACAEDRQHHPDSRAVLFAETLAAREREEEQRRREAWRVPDAFIEDMIAEQRRRDARRRARDEAALAIAIQLQIGLPEQQRAEACDRELFERIEAEMRLEPPDTPKRLLPPPPPPAETQPPPHPAPSHTAAAAVPPPSESAGAALRVASVASRVGLGAAESHTSSVAPTALDKEEAPTKSADTDARDSTEKNDNSPQ